MVPIPRKNHLTTIMVVDNRNDVLLKLIRYCADLRKKLLIEIGEFYPVVHYYNDGECNLLSPPDVSYDSVNDYEQVLASLILQRKINNYCSARDVNVRDPNGNIKSAIEFNAVLNGEDYDSAYIYYTKNDGGKYSFSELTF
ncbi:MAG: hypothetical protein JKX84_04010 [Flavobacteriales bacterium]|nr:hypothetical protein [Flavobacteriales bacterium]